MINPYANLVKLQKDIDAKWQLHIHLKKILLAKDLQERHDLIQELYDWLDDYQLLPKGEVL